jgi:hypothetical protein
MDGTCPSRAAVMGNSVTAPLVSQLKYLFLNDIPAKLRSK